MSESWFGVLVAVVRAGADRLAAVLPGILAAGTLLVAGLVLAMIARSILVRLLAALDRPLRDWGVDQALLRAGFSRSPREVLGRLVFWAIVLVFALLALDALVAPGGAAVTLLVIGLLPHLVAVLAIVLVGWLVGNFLGHAVLIAAVNAQVAEARLLSRIVRLAVVTFAAATALTQLGIGKEMVLLAFGITFGGLVLTLALAFGLGGRDLARRTLERRFGAPAAPDREEPDRMVHL